MDNRQFYFDLITKEMQAVFNGKLQSIIVYGSAATEEYREKISDINILVVFRDSETFLASDNIVSALKKRIKSGKINILFFTLEEFENARDVFTVEFNEIHQHHKLLFGADLIAEYSPNFEDMRLQLENNARRNLLKLRQSYITHKSDDLISISFASFLTILRNLLYLKTGNYISSPESLFDQLKIVFKIDSDVFRQIYEFKYNKKKGKADWQDIFKMYYANVSKITEIINDLGGEK